MSALAPPLAHRSLNPANRRHQTSLVAPWRPPLELPTGSPPTALSHSQATRRPVLFQRCGLERLSGWLPLATDTQSLRRGAPQFSIHAPLITSPL